MSDTFYALTINAVATDKTAYYGVQITSPNTTIAQGSFTFTPTGTTNTMVGTDPTNIKLNLPACAKIAGGVTLGTSESVIEGTIFVSPALAVPVTFTLYAFVPIDTVIVQPGQTEVPFRFNLLEPAGLTEEQALEQLNKVAPQAKRTA